MGHTARQRNVTLLLGALGVGAIAGAFLLPQVRARLSNNALLAAAGLVYAAALVVLVLVPSTAVALAVLLPAGVAWIAVLSSMNAAMQLFLPGWVRARGLAIYQVVLFGCQALGAIVWGALAAPAGLTATFLIAAGFLVAGLATIPRWPLVDTKGMDRSLAVYWPEPHLVLRPEPDAGPVLVTQTYTVSPEDEPRFLRAMRQLRLSRLRTGATSWALYRDGEVDRRFVELFVVPSWQEHLRQHSDRLTGTDRQFEEAAESLSHSPPQVSHLFYVNLQEP